jgi:ferrous iron transport protein A
VKGERKVKLGSLKKGDQALIAQVGGPGASTELIERLLEIGILEGSRIELVHEAPFGGDPIAVRVRGSIVALRRSEANAVEVFVYD